MKKFLLIGMAVLLTACSSELTSDGWDIIIMQTIVGYAIAIIGAIIAFLLSKGKTKKRKFIVWGITLILVISPFLSFAFGRTFAIITRDGWAFLIVVYIFPVIFIIGLVMLLVGIFKKEETWY